MEKPPQNNLGNERESGIRQAVHFVFEQNPELSAVGTAEQYMKYLNTIFPDSKVKDIVWHGTPNEKFEYYDSSKIGELDGGFFGRGFYFSKRKELAEHYQKRPGGSGGNLSANIINLKNPYLWKDNQKNFYYVDTMDLKNTPRGNILIKEDFEAGWEPELVEKYNKEYGEHISNLSELEYATELRGLTIIGTEFLKEKGYDGSIAVNPLSKEIEYVAFGHEQTYILGTDNDLEKFRGFIESENTTYDSSVSA
jgi:hypothetical protein